MLQALTIPIQLISQLIIVGNPESGNLTFDKPILMRYTDISNTPKAVVEIGVVYKFNNDTVTWYAAQEACIGNESTLAVVDSSEKYEYIMEMIQMKPDMKGPHVGVHRLFGNDQWVSVKTGLPPKQIPWAQKTWVENPINKCLAMWNDGSGVGADECNRLRPYLCETPIFMELN